MIICITNVPCYKSICNPFRIFLLIPFIKRTDYKILQTRFRVSPYLLSIYFYIIPKRRTLHYGILKGHTIGMMIRLTIKHTTINGVPAFK